MTQTLTRTTTYTRVDIGKTFESFRSDLRLMSMSSGCDEARVDDRADDVLAFANDGYLRVVHVRLFDAKRNRIRATTFTVCEDASGWTADMPGENLWPPTPGGSIGIILEHTDAWGNLSDARKQSFMSGLKLTWSPTNAETTYPDMAPAGTRRYSSNAFGLERRSFAKEGTS